MDQKQKQGEPGTEMEISEQRAIRREKLEQLRNSGQDPFLQTHFDKQMQNAQVIAQYDALQGQSLCVAGRMVSRRVMGKASFAHILDESGELQLYVKRDDVGEEAYAAFKAMDIGDVLGISGTVFKTRTGEVSIHVQRLTLLAKSLIPLPEKFHGLKDTDLRYRQRYVDLVVNPEVRKAFVIRSRVTKAMREFLDARGYMEVETPILQTTPGGANARPFITHHNTLGIDMYLRIATELHLKRLIVGGFEKVYEIGRIFRNEGMDIKHNPEFTTIELYQAYTDVYGIMQLTEELVAHVAKVALQDQDELKVDYEGHVIDLTPPYRKVSMAELVKEETGVDFLQMTDEQAREAARQMHIEGIKDGMSRGQVMYAVFDEKVEDKLIAPTFVLDYPVEVSPLAKRKPDDPSLTERFEFFAAGRELANAFSELNDPIDQYGRFVQQAKARAAGDEEAHVMDEDYVTALEYGMPPTGGMGMGIDRLCMLLAGQSSIRDIILFPTMKPRGQERAESPKASAEAQMKKPDFSKVTIEPLFADMVDFETFSKSDFRVVKVKDCKAVPKSNKLLQFTLDDGTGTDRIILSGIHAYYEPETLIGKTLVAITNLPPRKMMGIDSCGMLLSALHSEEGEERLNLLMVDDFIPAGAKLY